MKANDIIRLAEWMNTFKKEPKPARASRRKKKLEFDDDVDLAEVFLRLNAKEQRIKNAKEQIEKMMKKDEKKEEKKEGLFPNLNTVQRAVILTVAAPIVGLGYLAVLQTVASAVVGAFGVK